MSTRIAALCVLLLALALTPEAALSGSPGDDQNLLLNPWDFDPGDDGAATGTVGSGGSGAGDPWPRSVEPQPVWIADEDVRSHTLLLRSGMIAIGYATWDGQDSEIVVTLVDATSELTLRVTDDRFEDLAPLLVAGSEGELGIAWVRRRGPLETLEYAPLDLRSAQPGPARTLALLGPRVEAAAVSLALGQPVVVVARNARDRSLRLEEASPRGRASHLATLPMSAGPSLRIRNLAGGRILVSWDEGEGLRGAVLRDAEGRWSTPDYGRRPEP